jgi:N-acetylglucosaminyldiphosphoundecaprenol N-acetyl-beta-D-mannosaminyltransferase
VENTENNSIDILGFRIDAVTMEGLLAKIDDYVRSKTFHHFVLINPYLIIEARKREDYRRYISNAEVVTPDGVGLLLAAKLYNKSFPERVTGTDLMYRLAERSQQKGYRLYFLGAGKGIAEKAADELKKEYGNIHIAGTHDGYFSADQENKIIEEINDKKADILVVCMGAYVQEMFIERNRNRLNVSVAFGNGAALDFVSKRFKRAPLWMQEKGLEWLFRFLQEPGRLWKRYMIGNFVFIWLVMKDLFKGSKEK